MDSNNVILKIALPTPLRKTFDYLPPTNCNVNTLQTGARIKVPFGKQEAIGIIIHVGNESTLPIDKLKFAIELLDEEPLFTKNIMELYYFASKYYQHPLGDIIFSSLPPLLRDGAEAKLPENAVFILTELGAAANSDSLKHAIQQQKLILLLKTKPNGLTREEITQFGGQQKALTALLARGYIRKALRKATVPEKKDNLEEIKLNEYQKKAIEAITLNQGFGTFLLEGITGSGKTEVYLQCIEEVLKRNKQALVLIPEIGLTPQTVTRFQSRFSVPMSILHSNLSEKERANAWISALKGYARIVIGTRSAVLTPLPELGIIILDEEHDLSFKQQSGFHYSAKDLAIMRGKLESTSVILGSATPCLESLFNAQQNRFTHLLLPNRAGEASPPSFHIVDVRNKKLEDGFSCLVLERMQKHLNNCGQILIFLNRRGFAPILLCHHCGWTANCSRCYARYTYHSHLDKLICHHCASTQKLTKNCGSCQGTDLLYLGFGTQRLEKILHQHFPGVPVTRIDKDSTRRKGSMEKIISSIHTGTSQILIGTQMLAKGHHFPDVTMVVIVDVDNCLYSSDFRAIERLGQIITQVAGRAGRSSKPGEVYLQTHNPDHPVFSHLIQHGYSKLANFLLDERKAAQLPPYSHLVLFRAEASDETLPTTFLTGVKDLLKEEGKLQIFGPIPALMEKKAGKFRAQLLIQTKQRSHLQKSLQMRMPEIELLPSNRKVRWSLDVDPVEGF